MWLKVNYFGEVLVKLTSKIVVNKSIIWTLWNVGIYTVDEVIIFGSLDIANLFAIGIDEVSWFDVELHLDLEVFGQAFLWALPETESLLGLVVGEPQRLIVWNHWLAWSAPRQVAIDDGYWAAVLRAVNHFLKHFRTLDGLVENRLLGFTSHF